MKYQVGDIFIDSFIANKKIKSSIFKIEVEDNKFYYWLEYADSGMRNTYWTEEELDEMLASGKVKLVIKK